MGNYDEWKLIPLPPYFLSLFLLSTLSLHESKLGHQCSKRTSTLLKKKRRTNKTRSHYAIIELATTSEFLIYCKLQSLIKSDPVGTRHNDWIDAAKDTNPNPTQQKWK